ncbi:putative phosphatidate phosphatase [Thrips palmi]|uniref:Phosphatidate phosphatase n=1 Tax=Thrips palmi TaxID=161013 RepID=A0A6P8YKQ3_THRPL|nr:putative phosphatidate phosphatase [Thrips palmi]
MDRESKFLLRKIITDVAVLLTIGIPILMFFLFGKPYSRGFYCNDESIMHPFKESTVSNLMLYIVGMFLPIAVIILTELYIHHYITRRRTAYKFMGHSIPSWLSNSYKVIGVFGFGAATSQLTTDIAKYTIGRLRPHFISVCVPNINCTLPENQHKYFETFECTSGAGARKLKEARLSFPSGHSSFSAYTMLFLVCYLQSRMTFKGSKLLRHGIQYVCLMLSWSTAMSRISNYKHHWSDVLSGLLIGVIVAILTVVYVSDLFPRKYFKEESEPLNRVSPSNSRKRDQHPSYQSTQDHQLIVPMHTVVDGNNFGQREHRSTSPSLEPINRNVSNPA